MRAGKLDRRITLERNVPTKDGAGHPVDNWVELATVWASKQEIRDGERSLERLRADEVAAVATARFQVRWSAVVASLTPKDRLTFDGLRHEITALKEIGRREGREITAAARTDLDP